MFELLVDADLYAPEHLGRRTLLVGAGRVLWIGATRPKLPAEFEFVERNLRGRRLIPGFVEGHAHVTGGGGEAGYASRVPPLELSRFTTAGVTSVVGLLGTDDCVRTTGELVATIRGLRECGLGAWCFTGGYHVPPTTLTGSIRGDIVHVDCIVGVGELALSDHRSSQPTFDELLRIASEAHVAGLMTGKAGVVHLHMGSGERGLELVRRALAETELPARTFQPTHVNRKRKLFDEALELARSGSNVDVTAFPVEKGEDAWSAADAVLRFFESQIDPARLTISSDGGGCLPVFDANGRVAHWGVGSPSALIETLRELLTRGLALEKILPLITSNVAEFLRLEGRGRIAIGAHADLVVLDESSAISDVMACGRWHVIDGRPVVLGPLEPRR